MTDRLILRSLAVARGGALLALWPLGASAQRICAEGRADLQVGSVRKALQAAGYVVSATGLGRARHRH
jgi:hypothetical protein